MALMEERSTREIQLTLCEQCNLNCLYCYEHKKDNRRMVFSLAKRIISEEFSIAKEKQVDFLKIYFHGGEICLCFDLLKQICEWLWSQSWPIGYICNATTNGTLVHGGIKEWFKLNAHRFVLGLSLDGNKRMHDVNRCHSYDRIDLQFFRETWPFQEVKMTISPLTISSLSDGVVDIVRNGFRMTANLAYGCDWNSKDLKRSFADELYKLSIFFLENPSLHPPKKMMQKNLSPLGRAVFFQEKPAPKKGCGAGSHMRCYDVDGHVYPCQMFMPSSLGDGLFGKSVIEESDIIYSDVCMRCPALLICPTCIGSNYIQFGDLRKQEDAMCDFIKIEILNYTFFLYKALQNREMYSFTREMDDTSVAFSMKAIAYLQGMLQQDDIVNYCKQT